LHSLDTDTEIWDCDSKKCKIVFLFMFWRIMQPLFCFVRHSATVPSNSPSLLSHFFALSFLFLRVKFKTSVFTCPDWFSANLSSSHLSQKKFGLELWMLLTTFISLVLSLDQFLHSKLNTLCVDHKTTKSDLFVCSSHDFFSSLLYLLIVWW